MAKQFVFKILTAGEGGVGKTTLLHRYVNGIFNENLKMTVGVEFFEKELATDKGQCFLQLWDFGGQARFRFLIESYVRGAKGALLMFDLTRINSLEKIDEWVNILQQHNKNLPILFVGTKCDIIDQITVDDEYIQSIMEEFNFFSYLKISSKTGYNTEYALKILIDKIFQNILPK